MDAAHKVIHLAFPTDKELPSVLGFGGVSAFQGSGLAHSVQPGRKGGALMIGRQLGEGHCQAEGGTAGHSESLQCQQGIGNAHKKAKAQKGVQGKALSQQIRSTLDQLEAAKQGRNKHSEDLPEDHSPKVTCPNHTEGLQSRYGSAQQHHHKVCKDGGCQFARAFFSQLVVEPFRPGGQLLFQLLDGVGLGMKYKAVRLFCFLRLLYRYFPGITQICSLYRIRIDPLGGFQICLGSIFGAKLFQRGQGLGVTQIFLRLLQVGNIIQTYGVHLVFENGRLRRFKEFLGETKVHFVFFHGFFRFLRRHFLGHFFRDFLGHFFRDFFGHFFRDLLRGSIAEFPDDVFNIKLVGVGIAHRIHLQFTVFDAQPRKEE